MCFIKETVLKNFAIFTGKHQTVRPATDFLKKTPAQMFSRENWKIFKNTYVYRNTIL